MDWYKARFASLGGTPAPATYKAEQFEQMIAETRPDKVTVTTIDCDHHDYIVCALEQGCDAISEKPMTTDITRPTAIYDTVELTGKQLRVTFNYCYSLAFTRFRELIQQGEIGKPLSVDFSWMLDISHGADYFRRWYREQENSGAQRGRPNHARADLLS